MCMGRTINITRYFFHSKVYVLKILTYRTNTVNVQTPVDTNELNLIVETVHRKLTQANSDLSDKLVLIHLKQIEKV